MKKITMAELSTNSGLTVTRKLTITSLKICNLIPRFLKVLINTKNYNRRSRMFQGKLQ